MSLIAFSSGDMLLLVRSALLMLNVQTATLSVDGIVTSGLIGMISSGSTGSLSHEYSAVNAVMIIRILFIFIRVVSPYKRVSIRMLQDSGCWLPSNCSLNWSLLLQGRPTHRRAQHRGSYICSCLQDSE